MLPRRFGGVLRRLSQVRYVASERKDQPVRTVRDRNKRRFFYGIRILEMICLYVGRAMVGQREDRNDSRRRVGRKIAMFRLGDESNSPGNGCSQRRGRLTKKLDVLGDIQKL